MARKTMSGLYERSRIGHIDKVVRGCRLQERTGASEREEAEQYMIHRLESVPMISMMGEKKSSRKPYPLSWDEQSMLLAELPDHLLRMALSKVNTGCREQEVCKLRWDWETRVPALNTSVFLMPAGFGGRSVRKPGCAQRTSGRRPTRRRHTLGSDQSRFTTKHTFGRTLRAVSVTEEDRKALLGHKNGSITSHYSTPEVQHLIEAENKVSAY